MRTNRVLFKHALRAAIVPVITIFGLDFATLLAGNIGWSAAAHAEDSEFYGLLRMREASARKPVNISNAPAA